MDKILSENLNKQKKSEKIGWFIGNFMENNTPLRIMNLRLNG